MRQKVSYGQTRAMEWIARGHVTDVTTDPDRPRWHAALIGDMRERLIGRPATAAA